jgi:hypothetical protein
MLCKSCRSSHIEHNKIGFAIFGFFYDFIWNLQVTAKTHQRVKNHFTKRPLEVSNLHRSTLGLRTDPWEEPRPRNVVLRGLGAARPVGFRQGARRRGSGKGRSGPREAHATDLWLELGSGHHRQGGAAARRFSGRCG